MGGPRLVSKANQAALTTWSLVDTALETALIESKEIIGNSTAIRPELWSEERRLNV